MLADRVRELRYDVRRDFKAGTGEIDLNDQEFRVTAIRPGMGNISLDGLVESIEWTDGADDPTADLNAWIVMTGTLSLKKPSVEQRSASIHLGDGHVIRLEVRWGGEWREVWEMRIWQPNINDAGSWTFDLFDDCRLLAESTDVWRYKRGTKAKRRGWLYHEVVFDVCRRYRVPIGKVVRGKHRIKHLPGVRHASPLDVIVAAVDEERKATGRRKVIRWENGRLNVLPLKRASYLYTLREQLTGWTFATQRRGDLASQVTARATIKHKGGKTEKLQVIVTSKPAVRQYGFIHKEIRFHGVDDTAELRARAKRSLAHRMERHRTAQVTHGGIAFVRRGDAVRVVVEEEGYGGGRNSIAFCQSVSHRVAAGSYTMDLSLVFIDPQDPAELRKELDKAERARKRAAKK